MALPEEAEGQEYAEVMRAIVSASGQLVHALTAKGMDAAATFRSKEATLTSVFTSPQVFVDALLGRSTDVRDSKLWGAYSAYVRTNIQGAAADIVSAHLMCVRCLECDLDGGAELVSPGNVIVPDRGVLMHVWRSQREARRFHEALRRVAQTKFECMLPSPLQVPLAGHIKYQGASVSVVWLPPLVSATPVRVENNSASAAIVDMLRAGLQMPLMTTPAALFPGVDAGLYALPGASSVLPRIPCGRGRTLVVRLEAFFKLKERPKDMMSHIVAKQVPKAVDGLLQLQAADVSTSAQVKLVSPGLNVSRVVHMCGVNMGLLALIAADIAHRLANQEHRLQEVRGGFGAGAAEALEKEVGALQALQVVVRGHLVARTLKELIIAAMADAKVPDYAPAESVELERMAAGEATLKRFVSDADYFASVLAPRMAAKFGLVGTMHDATPTLKFERGAIKQVLAGVLHLAAQRSGLDMELGDKEPTGFVDATASGPPTTVRCPPAVAQVQIKLRLGAQANGLAKMAMDLNASMAQKKRLLRSAWKQGGNQPDLELVDRDVAFAEAPSMVLEELEAARLRDPTPSGNAAASIRACHFVRMLMPRVGKEKEEFSLRSHIRADLLKSLRHHSKKHNVSFYALHAVLANAAFVDTGDAPNRYAISALLDDGPLSLVPDGIRSDAENEMQLTSCGLVPKRQAAEEPVATASFHSSRAGSKVGFVALNPDDDIPLSPALSRSPSPASQSLSSSLPLSASPSSASAAAGGGHSLRCLFSPTSPLDEAVRAHMCRYASCLDDDAMCPSDAMPALVQQWVASLRIARSSKPFALGSSEAVSPTTRVSPSASRTTFPTKPPSDYDTLLQAFAVATRVRLAHPAPEDIMARMDASVAGSVSTVGSPRHTETTLSAESAFAADEGDVIDGAALSRSLADLVRFGPADLPRGAGPRVIDACRALFRHCAVNWTDVRAIDNGRPSAPLDAALRRIAQTYFDLLSVNSDGARAPFLPPPATTDDVQPAPSVGGGARRQLWFCRSDLLRDGDAAASPPASPGLPSTQGDALPRTTEPTADVDAATGRLLFLGGLPFLTVGLQLEGLGLADIIAEETRLQAALSLPFPRRQVARAAKRKSQQKPPPPALVLKGLAGIVRIAMNNGFFAPIGLRALQQVEAVAGTSPFNSLQPDEMALALAAPRVCVDAAREAVRNWRNLGPRRRQRIEDDETKHRTMLALSEAHLFRCAAEDAEEALRAKVASESSLAFANFALDHCIPQMVQIAVASPEERERLELLDEQSQRALIGAAQNNERLGVEYERDRAKGVAAQSLTLLEEHAAACTGAMSQFELAHQLWCLEGNSMSERQALAVAEADARAHHALAEEVGGAAAKGVDQLFDDAAKGKARNARDDLGPWHARLAVELDATAPNRGLGDPELHAATRILLWGHAEGFMRSEACIAPREQLWMAAEFAMTLTALEAFRRDWQREFDETTPPPPATQIVEPATQPAPEPATQPAPEPATQPAPEPATHPAPEPATQPAPESATRPAPEPATQPAPEPPTQPAPEPTPKPTAGPASDIDGDTLAFALQCFSEAEATWRSAVVRMEARHREVLRTSWKTVPAAPARPAAPPARSPSPGVVAPSPHRHGPGRAIDVLGEVAPRNQSGFVENLEVTSAGARGPTALPEPGRPDPIGPTSPAMRDKRRSGGPVPSSSPHPATGTASHAAARGYHSSPAVTRSHRPAQLAPSNQRPSPTKTESMAGSSTTPKVRARYMEATKASSRASGVQPELPTLFGGTGTDEGWKRTKLGASIQRDFAARQATQGTRRRR